MVMAVCILRGFQKEITQKVVGFGSHIVVESFSQRELYDASPISAARPEVESLRRIPHVKNVQFFAEKGGMIKTEQQIHGIIFKGIESRFDTSFYHDRLVEGRMPLTSDLVLAEPCDTSDVHLSPSVEIIVSKTIADKLQLCLGDKVRTYFWQGESYRARAFRLVGIYNTDLTDFDEHYVIGDIAQVQRLNGWGPDSVQGYELLLDNPADLRALEDVQADVDVLLAYDLTSQTIVQRNPTLFAWLDLLNSNIWLILIVMSLVCVVAIASTFLIMVFQNTTMIGVLKSLGADNSHVRRIFLIKSLIIIVQGIAYGDIVAFVLCLLQHYFHIVTLDSASYSMSFVPIDLQPLPFLVISLSTLSVCLLALLLPANHIAHISPAQTLNKS